MKTKANIWSMTCSKTKDSFAVTKHTPNIVLNQTTGDVCIITSSNVLDYDLTFNKKYYKIVDTIDIHDFMNLAKLLEGRSVKYRKIKESNTNATEKGNRFQKVRSRKTSL